MDTRSIEDITSATLKNLARVQAALAAYLNAAPNQRAQMLGSAFATQLDELAGTVQRIVHKLPRRGLRRMVRLEDPADLPPTLAETDDSRALTTWLVRHLQAEHLTYQYLADHARTGAATAAIRELAALFLAQSKRLALEAHRFQDL